MRSRRLLVECLEERLPPGDTVGALLAWSAFGATGSVSTQAPSSSSRFQSDIFHPSNQGSQAWSSPDQGLSPSSSGGGIPGTTVSSQSHSGKQAAGLPQAAQSAGDGLFAIVFNPFGDSAASRHAPPAPVPAGADAGAGHGGSSALVTEIPTVTLNVAWPGFSGQASAVFTATPTASPSAGVFTPQAAPPVNVSKILVDVQQIQFTGPNKVPIVINGSTPIGTPGGPAGSPDVEYVKSARSKPDDKQFWTPDQIAPAAFVEGKPLQAAITFSVSKNTVTSISVSATMTGPYGNFNATAVPTNNGSGTATFTSTAFPSTVDINAIKFQFTLVSITIGANTTNVNRILGEAPTFRVYTLKTSPAAQAGNPMARPWAQVLEVSAGLDKLVNQGKNDAASDIVAAEDLGEYQSLWDQFATSAFFDNINPSSTLVYIPSVTRTRYPNGVSDDSTQEYGLADFLYRLQSTRDTQQCNDNADLLAILTDSLGVVSTPLAIRPVAPATKLVETAPYLRTGTTTAVTDIFVFHQVDSFNNLIYDPSAGAVPAAGQKAVPFSGLTLNQYLNAAFPGQVAAGIKGGTGIAVTTLTVGAETLSTALRIGGLTPNRSKTGLSRIVRIIGANLDANTKVAALELDGSLAANVTITNVKLLSDTEITFGMTIDAGAAARNILIAAYKPDGTTGAIAPDDYDAKLFTIQ